MRENVDVFFQDPPPEVDTLFVIDNSGSMQAYQLFLGLRFNDFLTWFDRAGVDYRIAVTTTTVETPPYLPQGCTQQDVDAAPAPGHLNLDTVIAPDTPDAESVFADIVHVGTCGDGNRESGLQASRLALSPELLSGANAGFLREDASLSVIYVSDEQDYSTDPVYLYTNDLYAAKGARSRDVVNADAMVITDPTDCIIPLAASSEGSRYVAIADQTGGVTSNLCNQDFSQAMVELSFNASRMHDEFVLTDLPATDTLEVSVGGERVPCTSGQWTYALRDTGDGSQQAVIVFDRERIPQPGARIAVRYDYGDGDPANFCPAAAVVGAP